MYHCGMKFQLQKFTLLLTGVNGSFQRLSLSPSLVKHLKLGCRSKPLQGQYWTSCQLTLVSLIKEKKSSHSQTLPCLTVPVQYGPQCALPPPARCSALQLLCNYTSLSFLVKHSLKVIKMMTMIYMHSYYAHWYMCKDFPSSLFCGLGKILCNSNILHDTLVEE